MTDPLRATIVFDLDGTLADTAPDLIATLGRVLAPEGVAPLTLHEGRGLMGAGARALIERSLARADRRVEPDRLETLYRHFLDDYAANIADKTQLFDGAGATLDRFLTDGHRLAVCTNKLETHAVRLLDRLGVGPKFLAICGRDSFAFSKPDARHLTETIRLAGGAAHHAVMVGDSRTDIDTARNAKIPVVAVSFGYTDVPVATLDPDAVIDHFDALPAAVDRLLNRRRG